MSFSPRALAVDELAWRLLAAHGLPDWSFGFNRSKLHMGQCRYGPQRILLSVHFVELNGDEAVLGRLTWGRAG